MIYQNVSQLTHCVILTLGNPFLTKENDSFIEAVFRFLKYFSILIFNIRDLFFFLFYNFFFVSCFLDRLKVVARLNIIQINTVKAGHVGLFFLLFVATLL